MNVYICTHAHTERPKADAPQKKGKRGKKKGKKGRKGQDSDDDDQSSARPVVDTSMGQMPEVHACGDHVTIT